jgi:hypothetical protein
MSLTKRKYHDLLVNYIDEGEYYFEMKRRSEYPVDRKFWKGWKDCQKPLKRPVIDVVESITYHIERISGKND